MGKALIETEIIRLNKLEKYYKHFKIENRYGIDFKEFTRKVDNDTWEPYLAESMNLDKPARES